MHLLIEQSCVPDSPCVVHFTHIVFVTAATTLGCSSNDPHAREKASPREVQSLARDQAADADLMWDPFLHAVNMFHEH